MKCCSYVLWQKGSGDPYLRPAKIVSWWQTSDQGPFPENPHNLKTADYLRQGYEPCNGDIKVTVAAYDCPNWGGTSAELSIEVECQNCGSTFHPEFPDTAEGLSELLTQMLDCDVGKLVQELRDNARARVLAKTVCEDSVDP